MTIGEDSEYYQHSVGTFGVTSRISYIARQRIFERFTQVCVPTPEQSVLDIGVTSDTSFRESNYFEQFYPYKAQIVCVGTENGAHLEKMYPGLKFVRVQPGEPLPFSEKQFDIVFSNAVVEHVGNTQAQRAFVAEACRVGKRVFITTPNRWFPVEHHTSVPLLHYLPKSVYRWIIRKTALRFWSYEENLNLLTHSELATLFPEDALITIERVGIGFGPFLSNLIAYSTP